MTKNLAIICSVLLVLAAIIVVICLKYSGNNNQFTIGAILPLSGSSAQYGRFVQEGFELAIQEINDEKSDSAKSAKIHVMYEDDQAVPRLAALAMQKLAQVDKVPIVFGSWSSSCVLAQAPIANSNHVPVLAEAQSPQIRDAGDYIFRIQPDSRDYLRVLAPYACKTLSLKTFAILFVNNDYGRDQAEVFKKLVEENGAKVLFQDGFMQGAQDFRTVLTKLNSFSPEGVFLPAYAEAGIILKQTAEQDIKTQFLGSAPMENPDVILTAGKAAEGMIYVHHFDPDSEDPKVKQFLRNYRAKYGHSPEGYAALAYDAAFVIRHVLSKCGPSREAIKTELYKVQNFPGVAGTTSFDDHGDVIKPIIIRMVRGGQFVTIKPHEN